MFGLDFGSESRRINDLISKSGGKISLERFIEKEIDRFVASTKRKDMIVAQEYYRGLHDILKRKRKVIGDGGRPIEVSNLPNSRVVDNQYARLVDQKNNYLLSKPVTMNSDNKDFLIRVKNMFNNEFWRLIKNVGEDCLNCGIGWIYPYYQDGRLRFKRFKASEILPFWADDEHTILDMAVRIYRVDGYEGEREVTYTKVEVYTKEGIEHYSLEGRKLVRENEDVVPYITDSKGNRFGWDRVPLIAFKLNAQEIGLINRVKGLQDALNEVRNDFINNMQEDARNTILVLKNYDGTNLGEFRKNLSEYGVVKVKTVDGACGDVATLKIDVDCNSYNYLIEMLKKAIVENARGFDCKDDRMSNNPNELNIRSMYGDIDLDANSMEMEFKRGIDEILWYVKADFEIRGVGEFDGVELEIIFNRDQLINETEVIDNCVKSQGLLSRETVVGNHPWVKDIEKEL